MAFLRSLPGVDLVPPTKIQQISLPDLTINYNFKDVPRYDRCTTCHQGIDRSATTWTPTGKPMHKVFASHPHLTDGATAARSQGKARHRPGCTSTPTARTRSTASAARSATAAKARGPTSPIPRTRPTT